MSLFRILILGNIRAKSHAKRQDLVDVQKENLAGLVADIYRLIPLHLQSIADSTWEQSP